MKRLTIAALLVGLGALSLLLSRSGGERGRAVPFAPAEPARATTDGASELVAPRTVSVGPEEAPAPPAGERRRAAADEASPVTGVVRLSAPLPAGEEVLVAAAFRDAPGGELTVRMAPDRSFALAVPPQATDVRLGLRSPHLFLEAPVHVVPGQSGVVLEPEMLAVVAGEIVAPLAWPARGMQWAQVQVRWRLAPGLAVDPDLAQRAESLAQRAPFTWPRDGRFELPRVAPGVDLELGVTNLFGPETTLALAPLAPGERREVRVELRRGITVSGRVIDEHGEPVAGVAIHTDASAPAGGYQAPTRTAADGRFVLERLPARPLRIATSSYALLRSAEATIDGTHGDVTDVVLAVARGGGIDGTVAWPDGTPAEGVQVTTGGTAARTMFDMGGGFALRGLAEGLYRVEAQAVRDGIHFRASADDVPLGSELALVLARAEGAELEGTVVDAAGTPVAEFQVFATRSDISAARPADGRDGRFHFTGLEPGRWSLSLHADGYQRLRQEVEIGATNAPLRIELVAAARIRGTVVDPSGAPVAGATVIEAQLAPMLRPGGPPGNTTDARGAFDVEANAERVELVASAGGFAPSAPVAVESVTGATAADVVLVLRDACRVEGRVLDENGRPVPYARVLASDPSLTPPGFLGTRDANADGDFVFDALPPGSVRLFTSRDERSEASATVTVEPTPGRVTRVELRF